MLLRSLLASIVLVGSAACGDDASGPDAGSDGGVDAGVDAGRDGGSDGGRDGGLDAADAGVDEAGWVALPDVPLGCVVERATHPERLFVPRWVSCGEGCEYLAPDERWMWGADASAGGADGDGRILSLIAYERAVFDEIGVETPRTTFLVDVTSGAPVAALREKPVPGTLCITGSVGYAGGHVAFPIAFRDTESAFEAVWVFHGPIETMKDVDEPVLKLDGGDMPGFGNVLQSTSASPTTAAFEVQPLGEVWIVEGGEVRRRAGIGSAVPGNPQNVALIGRRALWNEWRTDVRIAHATFDEEAAVFHEVEGARVLFATDGIDLAWVQAYGWTGSGFSGPIELWTARYRDDSVEPRRVIERYEHSSLGVVGGGLWVAGAGDDESRILVDLETGARRRLARDPRAIWLRPPVWVTASEIGQAGRWRPGDGTIFDTFFRLATSAAVPVEEE